MEEYEIEFKNLITKEEFNHFKQAFHLMEDAFILQKNYYFDTATFDLKQLKSALRIREKQNDYVITLKEPYKDGLLETHQPCKESDLHHLIQTGDLQDGPVKEKLKPILDGKPLTFIGELSTARAQVEYKQGLLVFDHSFYLNHEDFEIEYEVTDIKKGKPIFEALLATHHIPFRKTKNKIQRLFEIKSDF